MRGKKKRKTITQFRFLGGAHGLLVCYSREEESTGGGGIFSGELRGRRTGGEKRITLQW